MKNKYYILGGLFCLSISQSMAQDTLLVMKGGQAVYKRAVSEVDSIIFKPKTTISNPNSVEDISGNMYPAVTIGTQVWMGENLRVEKYNDGTAITLVTSDYTWASNYTNNTTIPMMCYYENSAANKATYGALYNWYVVNTGKLCPKGWHVPTDAEWTTLTTYLGGESGAGLKLKNTSGWTGQNGTNEVNFAALPGGIRGINYGWFSYLGSIGYWWSGGTSVNVPRYAWHWIMNDNDGIVERNLSNHENGLSVRCLRD